MNVEQVLADFGRDSGFGPITLNASNMARLEFDGGLAVDLEYSPQRGLFLYGAVAPVEAKPGGPLLQALLEANAPSQNRDGFVFSIDPAQRSILLSSVIEPGRISAAELARVLERFLDMLETWRQHVKTAFPPGAPESAGTPAPGAWHVRA